MSDAVGRSSVSTIGAASLLLLLLCCGCQQEADTDRLQQAPVAFIESDECHVCGMIIMRFPGPKGQTYISHREQPLKFCSTRDLFAWLLQPETTAIVQEIYVHDMAQTDWAHPHDTRLVNARLAWYVLGSERTGAMGPTLVSFALQHDAQKFAHQYGGRLLQFDDISLQVLASMMLSANDRSHP